MAEFESLFEQQQQAALEAKEQLLAQRRHLKASVINRPAWVENNKPLPKQERIPRHREFLANSGFMDEEFRMAQGRYGIKGDEDKWIPRDFLEAGKAMMRDLKDEGDGVHSG